MKKKIEYIKYIHEHRKNVKKACKFWYKEWQELYPHTYDVKRKIHLRLLLKKIKLTHDLSKYGKKEFKPYMNWFYSEYGVAHKPKDKYAFTINNMIHKSYEDKFELAWQHHLEYNKHHWNHWVVDWDKYYNNQYYHKHYPLDKCLLEKPIRMPMKYMKEMIIDWTAMGYKFGDTAQDYYLRNYNNIILDRDTRFHLEIALGLLFYNVPWCEGNEEYWMTIKELKEHMHNNNRMLNEVLQPTCVRYNIDFTQYDI